MKFRSFALHPDSFLLFEPVCEYTVLFIVLGMVKMEPCHGQQCFVETQLLCRHLPTGVQALCTWKRAALWCRLEMRTLPVPRRCQGCDLRATESSKAEFSRAKYWKKMIQSTNPHSHHIHITLSTFARQFITTVLHFLPLSLAILDGQDVFLDLGPFFGICTCFLDLAMATNVSNIAKQQKDKNHKGRL